ncbi:hypothetical protein MPY17_30565 [Rhodococcus opacus]|uniref:hypothetical protein n=1 Tax=Rhodococcus opacus TaxID=37919 RepID=UPI001FF1BEA9|nr:hypothetical protein [Rhodococcus opacus]UOT03249.1 hypothetical protein MPY17_30565 [Rhodococcus opacus]
MQGHPKLGVGVESLRTWTRQALIDADKVPGVTTEQQRIKDLERETQQNRGYRSRSDWIGFVHQHVDFA